MLALPFVFFSLFLVIHVLWWRLNHSHRPGFSTLCVHGLGWFGILTSNQWFLEPGWNGILYSASIYLFLLVAYFHLYLGVGNGVSLRVLGELSAKNEGTMTQEQLRATYPSRYMFSRRLEALVQNGWIEKKADLYSNLPKGNRLARVTKRLRNFYRLEVTG